MVISPPAGLLSAALESAKQNCGRQTSPASASSCAPAGRSTTSMLERLHELFERMLHDLMAGEISVDDLALSAGALEGSAA